jgi:DNA-directed RNA polymerase subunit N (RpoN/RPB10)
MLQIICPSCGEILANKELVLIKEMNELSSNLGVDYNYLSKTKNGEENTDYSEGKKKIINKLCRKYCCKMLMVSYIDKVQFVE